ncbi:hypothetical protein DFJ43DRAFT_1005821 [Lentinula guzmanii]|uniref:Uncharacterized protein n=1 Tax=Lentinula guzmanii TaxID=2804957 RepID=A0AA38JBM1_9AGAR|nr:hypothetical protein DFJ43DRAFT_1005821 [Lentinula guzmanii]
MCSRVIENEGRAFSTQEVYSRWYKLTNDRSEPDRQMTHQKYGKKALSKKLVLQTWKSILAHEEPLPQDWTTMNGVLVGITGMVEEED